MIYKKFLLLILSILLIELFFWKVCFIVKKFLLIWFKLDVFVGYWVNIVINLLIIDEMVLFNCKMLFNISYG